MSVLIKGVDKELYARFKAEAAMRGLRLNEALCKAMEYWIKMEKTSSEDDAERMINNATYRRLIPQLLKDHEGEWIVISKGVLVGIFKSRSEAIMAIKTNNLSQNCNIVSPITKKRRRVTLGFGRKLK
ncbi:MAG: hypothetical protein ACTSRS_12845 [Candidatus Helarchaeota archaeon]